MFVIDNEEVQFIINALRVAAETYRKDAVDVEQHPGMAAQLRRQAERADDLALKIEVEG
jgi:hypothetical protein